MEPAAKRQRVNEAGRFNIVAQLANTEASARLELKAKEEEEKRKRASDITSIENVLLGAETELKKHAKTHGAHLPIEIEARFGVQTNSFESGVQSPQEFQNLKRMLIRRFKMVDKRETTDFIWNHPTKAPAILLEQTGKSSGNIRLSYENGINTRCEVKYRIQDGQINWPMKHTYSVRISASSETRIDPPHALDYIDPVTVRKKKRTSFTPNKVWNQQPITASNCLESPGPLLIKAHPLADLCLIDLTEVRSKETTVGNALAEGDGGWTRVQYEVEIELKPEALARAEFGAENNSPDKLRQLAENMYDFILELQEIIADARRDQFCDTFLQRVTDMNATNILRTRLNRCCHIDESNADFPGCMPVNFSRKHIDTVREEGYYVSEKTDGVRYLMLLVKNTTPHARTKGAIYVTDRSYVFYRVGGFMADELVEQFTTDGDTLLDGELVRNLEWDDPVFLLFDVLEWNGVNMLEQPYGQRISMIAHVVSAHDQACKIFHEGCTDKLTPPRPHQLETFPFRLAGKSILPKKDIASVFAHLRPHPNIPGERCYRESGRAFKRFHGSDGIILCPDAPYQLKTQPNLFKWKYLDKETIDFHVEFVYPTDPGRGEVKLFVQGDREEILIRTLTLDHRQNERLRRDIAMARLGPDQPPIAEFGYDIVQGQWQYHLLRKDKPKPNHIKIVFETMESIAENMGASELQFRLLEHNDAEIARASEKQEAIWAERLGRLLAARRAPPPGQPRPPHQQQHYQQQQQHPGYYQPGHPPAEMANAAAAPPQYEAVGGQAYPTYSDADNEEGGGI